MCIRDRVYSVFGGETGEGNANDNVVTIKGSAAVTGKSNAVYGGYTDVYKRQVLEG